jgi:hypothetical protein
LFGPLTIKQANATKTIIPPVRIIGKRATLRGVLSAPDANMTLPAKGVSFVGAAVKRWLCPST